MENPLFFNCWNQNVICSFISSDGSRWSAVFAKHSLHFPIYGASYENLMLWNHTTNTGYGLTRDFLPSLYFDWRNDSFRLRYKGKVFIYGEGGLEKGETELEIEISFRTLPVGQDRFFLKKLLPFSSRFITGAVFENQILLGDRSGLQAIRVGGDFWPIPWIGVKGHLENGCSSLINSRPWLIPYRYLGVLRDDAEGVHFFYRWAIRPLQPRNWIERGIAVILRNISKEVRVIFRGGKMLRKREGTPDCAPPEIHRELFSIPCSLGEFTFTRSLVEAQDDRGHPWCGIEEDFKHPELDGQGRI